MRQNIKLLALLNFFTDFKLYSGILIIYLVRVTGSYTLAMSLFSVTSISSALFEIPTGVFSDIIGRKRTVLFGAISATFAVLCYAIGMNYWILFVGAVFDGLSRSWYSGNNDAFLHDSLHQLGKKETYAHYLGKTSAMFQVALMVSAVIGSILAQQSFPLIMWISVIPQIICILLSFFLTDPIRYSKGQSNIYAHIKLSALTLWKNLRLRLLSIHDILNFGIGESSFSFSAAFINSVWPLWAVGFAKMISYGTASISYWFSGAFIKKFGEYNILIIASIYKRVAYFIACLFPGWFSPILMSSSSIFHGITSVCTNTLEQKEYTHEQRATMGSINSFLGNIFYGICAPLIGILADRYGSASALIVVQFALLSVLYINVRLKYLSKKST